MLLDAAWLALLAWGLLRLAWIVQARAMQRNGFKFRKSPESYALGCLLKDNGPDMPSDEALHNSRPALERYWQQFQNRRSTDET